MKRVYVCWQAPCSSTVGIVEWLNKLGLDGWLMCGKVYIGHSKVPSFYFTREERKSE